MELMENEVFEPVSPAAQYLNSTTLSISVIVVLELEVPFDDSLAIPLLNDLLLPINPRFSSIMVTDQDGRKQWKRVEVNLKDHVKIPVFPSGMAVEFYDQSFDYYLSEIATEPLLQSQPLWEVHIINYPTSIAECNLVFKIHHSIGDGYSLMAALFSCLKRADNPSLPLTLPSIELRSHENGDSNKLFKTLLKILSSGINTVTDFSWSLMKSTLVKDDKTPIRSEDAGIEFRPIAVTTMAFSLDHIKQIKENLGVTINDVITGIIFLGTRLFMQEMNKESSSANSTALVLLNTRMLRSYQTIQEMVKPNAESPWGNHFSFLHVEIPKLINEAETSNPLEFVIKAHEIIKKKRNSAAVYLTGWLIESIRKLKGPEAGAKYLHTTMKNSSMTITNMIGPVEKMTLANHPIKGMYFVTVGVPKSLCIPVVSYMGELRVTLVVEEGFIDHQRLKSCIENAFQIIFKAACKVTAKN